MFDVWLKVLTYSKMTVKDFQRVVEHQDGYSKWSTYLTEHSFTLCSTLYRIPLELLKNREWRSKSMKQKIGIDVSKMNRSPLWSNWSYLPKSKSLFKLLFWFGGKVCESTGNEDVKRYSSQQNLTHKRSFFLTKTDENAWGQVLQWMDFYTFDYLQPLRKTEKRYSKVSWH